MNFIIIVVFVVAAGIFIASWYSPAIKEKLASVWAALVALLIAAGTYAASWWTSTPIDTPPM